MIKTVKIVIGIISVLMIFFGIRLAIVNIGRDLIYFWIFLGIGILGILILVALTLPDFIRSRKQKAQDEPKI